MAWLGVRGWRVTADRARGAAVMGDQGGTPTHNQTVIGHLRSFTCNVTSVKALLRNEAPGNAAGGKVGAAVSHRLAPPGHARTAGQAPRERTRTIPIRPGPSFRGATPRAILHSECILRCGRSAGSCEGSGAVVMRLPGAVTVVTGGASGIGRAMAARFAREGARAVVVADIDKAGARAAAADLSCGTVLGTGLDVARADQVSALADRVEREIGPIDLWCSNAGVGGAPELGTDADWERAWQVHVRANVHVARIVVPRMVDRGRGHVLVTASAAGLLTELDSAAYAVTKHATVAMAEWLAIRYGDSGVGVSCLCPQGVRTPLLAAAGPDSATLAAGRVLEPEEVAAAVVEGLADGRFLILPHPEVAAYERQRTADRDRWLAGMRRFRARLRSVGSGRPQA